MTLYKGENASHRLWITCFRQLMAQSFRGGCGPQSAINASTVSLNFTLLAHHLGEECLDQPVGRRRLLPHYQVAGLCDLVVAYGVPVASDTVAEFLESVSSLSPYGFQSLVGHDTRGRIMGSFV